MEQDIYDCAIAGAGIAGLSLAILLARANKKVVVFEKETFPFSKVSGGYFSNEGIDFLSSLGIELRQRQAPAIERLFMTSANGQTINTLLDVGGAGIARHEIDNELYHIALKAGVTVYTGTKVRQMQFVNSLFRISTDNKEFISRTAAGAFGRSSNIDVELGRKYKAKDERKLFVAVEHHLRIPFNPALVEIHAFPGGYCGISAYGKDLVNLSYISSAASLKAHNGIAGLEKNLLSVNPYLKKYFEEGEFLLHKPLTISHVYFKIKEPVKNHILMIGDAAGNIAPISGNGMSIAVCSARLAGEAIINHLDKGLTLEGMEQQYAKAYYKTFARRIKVSKQLTHLLMKPRLTNALFPFFKTFPFLVDFVSRQIHGDTI